MSPVQAQDLNDAYEACFLQMAGAMTFLCGTFPMIEHTLKEAIEARDFAKHMGDTFLTDEHISTVWLYKHGGVPKLFRKEECVR